VIPREAVPLCTNPSSGSATAPRAPTVTASDCRSSLPTGPGPASVTEQGPEGGLDIIVAFPAAGTSCTRRPTRSPPAARLSPESARIGVGDVRFLRRMRRATDQLRGDKGSCPSQERP
jgi:hypothetical protein